MFEFYLRIEAGWGSKAVTSTKRNVLLTSDDEDWCLGWVHAAGCTTDGKELANGHGLAGHSGDSKDLGVEVTLLRKTLVCAYR